MRSRSKIPDINIVDLRRRRPQGKRADASRQPIPSPQGQGVFAAFFESVEEPVVERKKERVATKKIGRRKVTSLKSILLFSGALAVVGIIFLSVTVIQHAQQTKGRVLGESVDAFESLQNAKNAFAEGNFDQAKKSLTDASAQFEKAKSELDSIEQRYGLLLKLPGITSSYVAGVHLVSAGQALSQLGLDINTLIEMTKKNANGYQGFFEAYQQLQADISTQADAVHEHLGAVRESDVAESFRSEFVNQRDHFLSLYSGTKRIMSLVSTFSKIAGIEQDASYLFVFQNNEELRPTGGFIGSVARVELSKGSITNLVVPEGGSYDISGVVKTKYAAPKPLQIVNPVFSFQDANWFSDFPSTAQELQTLYVSAGNKPVDGVVAFTPDVLVSLLKITGPIAIQSEQSQIITASNFLETVRNSIEAAKSENSNKPKKIIAQLMPLVIQKIFNLQLDQQIKVAGVLDSALQTKDFLVYSNDQALQGQIRSQGFAGDVSSPDTNDYLAVVNANIAGGKTDRLIDQHVELKTEQTVLGIVNTVTVIRTHHGVVSDPIHGVANLSYIRIYVPEGAQVLTADGWFTVSPDLFHKPDGTLTEDPLLSQIDKTSSVDVGTKTTVTHEYGKTVFGNWMNVEPEHSTTASIQYRLPSTVVPQSDWSLYVRKQPGINSTFTWIGLFQKNIQTILSSATDQSQTVNGTHLSHSLDLTRDVAIGAVFH